MQEPSSTIPHHSMTTMQARSRVQLTVTLPPIRYLLDEVELFEAANGFPPLRIPFKPTYTHANQPPSPVSDAFNSPTSVSSAPRIASRFLPYSRPFQSIANQHRRSCGPFPHHDPNESTNRLENYPQNPSLPLLSPGSNPFETVSPSSSSYSVPLASSPGLRETPPFEEPTSTSLGRTVLAGAHDETPADAMDPRPDQVYASPPVPSRPTPQPTPEHDYLFSALSSTCCSSSPSFPVSTSIEGSPRIADSRLPYPLVPATPSQRSLEAPLTKDQIVTPQSCRKRTKPDGVTAPRIDDKLTKDGKYYTRCRPEDLRLPPDRKLLTRKTWTKWENKAASAAFQWYKEWNQSFNIRKSSDSEQHVALPIIYRYIIWKIEPQRWRRSYDGLLKWADNVKGRPTTRNPSRCSQSTTRRPATRGTSRNAAVRKP